MRLDHLFDRNPRLNDLLQTQAALHLIASGCLIATVGLTIVGIPLASRYQKGLVPWVFGSVMIAASGSIFVGRHLHRIEEAVELERKVDSIDREDAIANAIFFRQTHRLNCTQAAIDALDPRSKSQPEFVQEPLPLPESPQFFDWQLFNTDPNKWPHLAIVGGTGDGKSYTTEWAINWLDGVAIVCHPHRKPKDFPGIKAVYSGGRNYGDWEMDEPVNFEDLVAGNAGKVSFASFLKTIEVEMDRRYKLYEKGVEDYPMINVVLDEFNTALSKIPDAIEAWKNLIREARKVKIRLLCLLQNDSVKSLKIEGDGALRECLKYVRLGGFAKAHAKRLKDDSLIAWTKAQKYPILVEEYPAIIAQLPPGSKPIYPHKTATQTSIQQPINGGDFPSKPTGTYQEMVEKFERILRQESAEPEYLDSPGSLNPEIDSPLGDSPYPLPRKDSLKGESDSPVSKYFPETSEIELWQRILEIDTGTSTPSDLIRSALKCMKSSGSRSYKDVGKPTFIYLVRKYGSTEHLTRFKEFLSNDQP
ncbi:MAG: hypothetical protein ACM37W_17445 [Actinomycetota bacterium]